MPSAPTCNGAAYLMAWYSTRCVSGSWKSAKLLRPCLPSCWAPSQIFPGRRSHACVITWLTVTSAQTTPFCRPPLITTCPNLNVPSRVLAETLSAEEQQEEDPPNPSTSQFG